MYSVTALLCCAEAVGRFGRQEVDNSKDRESEAPATTRKFAIWKDLHRWVQSLLSRLDSTFSNGYDSLQFPLLQLTVLVDHMLSVEWTAEEGWLAPKITPYQNLSLDPATCVFHYAFECFEGMKAYKV